MELTHFAFDVEEGVATVLLDRAGESMNTIGPSSVSTRVSIASRVVPARSCTTDRSVPTNRLNRDYSASIWRPPICNSTTFNCTAYASHVNPMNTWSKVDGSL